MYRARLHGVIKDFVDEDAAVSWLREELEKKMLPCDLLEESVALNGTICVFLYDTSSEQPRGVRGTVIPLITS